MAWETRGNNSYYYRKKRVGQQVISEYIGAGPFADMVALLDEEERLKREYEYERWEGEKVADQELVHQIDDAVKLVRQLIRAACVAGGCYQHKRQWRRYASSDTRGSNQE